MRKLGGLDAMFLYAETESAPMHVGSLTYLEVDEAKRASFHDDLRAMLSDRLHLVPYLTSRLYNMPLAVDHPVWVRDPEFDIANHVHRIHVESPGTVEQVEALAAELYQPRMDRKKPLWEMWVIEGLANGQLALLQKTHHSCIDGASAIKAAGLLFDLTDEPREVEPEPDDFWNEDRPSSVELVTAAYENTASKFREGLGRLPGTFNAATNLTKDVVAGKYRMPPMTAPRTRLNRSIDYRRSFSNAEMSLSVLKAISKAARVKINDVVLLICGEGLKRYLARHGEEPAASLIGNCPVSLHKKGGAEIKNQVTAMNVDMATGIEDLRKRLQAIHLSANGSKGTVAAFDTVMPTDFAAWGMPMFMQALSRITRRGLMFDFMPAMMTNVVVSNVPGFQTPLYIAGAKLVAQMPMSIVIHGVAVNLTITSYCDRMDLGITAATRRVPDIQNLRHDLLSAYADLARDVLGKDHDSLPQPSIPVSKSSAKATTSANPSSQS